MEYNVFIKINFRFVLFAYLFLLFTIEDALPNIFDCRVQTSASCSDLFNLSMDEKVSASKSILDQLFIFPPRPKSCDWPLTREINSEDFHNSDNKQTVQDSELNIKNSYKNYCQSYSYLQAIRIFIRVNPIIRVDSLLQILLLPCVKNVSSNSLYIFDCDDVLMTLSGSIFKNREVLSCIQNEFPQISHTEFYNRIMSIAPRSLVNRYMPQLLIDLAKKNAKVIILTSVPFSFATQREKQLKDLGYKSCMLWPQGLECKLTNLIDKYGNNPYIRNGVLYCGSCSKGEALSEFLRLFGRDIKSIFMVDDNINNLISVNNAIADQKILFLGFEYLEAVHIALGNPLPIEIWRQQIQVAIMENRWIPDELLPKLEAAQKSMFIFE